MMRRRIGERILRLMVRFGFIKYDAAELARGHGPIFFMNISWSTNGWLNVPPWSSEGWDYIQLPPGKSNL